MAGWSQLASLIWLGISSVFLYTIWRTNGMNLSASFAYPAVCAGLAAGLSLYCLVRSGAGGWYALRRGGRAPALVFAALFAYWRALTVFGFLISSIAVVCVLGLACAPRARWVVVLGTGIVVSLAVWLLFNEIVGTALPTGRLVSG